MTNCKLCGQEVKGVPAFPDWKGTPTENTIHKKCRNIEHPDKKHKEGKCEYCGLSDCSPNFAYHFCRGYR